MFVICGSLFFSFLQVGDCLHDILLVLRGFSKLCVHHIYAMKYCVLKIKGVPTALGKNPKMVRLLAPTEACSGLKIVFCTAELYSVVINSFCLQIQQSCYGRRSLDFLAVRNSTWKLRWHFKVCHCRSKDYYHVWLRVSCLVIAQIALQTSWEESWVIIWEENKAPMYMIFFQVFQIMGYA